LNLQERTLAVPPPDQSETLVLRNAPCRGQIPARFVFVEQWHWPILHILERDLASERDWLNRVRTRLLYAAEKMKAFPKWRIKELVDGSLTRVLGLTIHE